MWLLPKSRSFSSPWSRLSRTGSVNEAQQRKLKVGSSTDEFVQPWTTSCTERPNRIIEDADVARLTHPKPPPKIFRHMSPNDIASRFFTSWYTIYERVSNCQATAVGATTEFQIRLQAKAVGIGSRLIIEGCRFYWGAS